MQHGTLDHMVQFAHIPWQQMMDHLMHRGRLKHFYLLAISCSIAIEKMLCE